MFDSAARPPASATAAMPGSSHPHPKPSSGAQQQASGIPSTMAAPESNAVPPKDPFRTRRQLPRTPLSSKSGNRLPGSRTRSASPGVTKIPRSSHIARSESPARASAGLGNPTGRGYVAGAGQAAVESVNENVSAVTTPARRAEEELLAAFARTPKVVRTPPKSSAPSAAPSDGSAAFPAREEPLGERLTAQLPSLLSAGAGSAPQPAPALPAGTTCTASTAEAYEVPIVDPVGGQGAPAAEPPAEQVFGRSAKLSRTLPRSGEAAGVQQRQQQQQQGLGFPPAAVRASASAAGRPAKQPTATAPAAGGGATGSPPLFASPSTSSADSSCANAANVRSLLGSDSKTADVAGSAARTRRGRAGAALTPAAFEGLISVMRTPSTGMKRRGALVNDNEVCLLYICMLLQQMEAIVKLLYCGDVCLRCCYRVFDTLRLRVCGVALGCLLLKTVLCTVLFISGWTE